MFDTVALPLVAFAAAAVILTITPGIDTVLVLRSATSGGPRSGVAASLGICAGLFVWGAGAAFGLTALLSASEVAFTVLKWVGAVYLVVLGIGQVLRPRTSIEAAPPEVGGHGSRRDAVADALVRGLLTNVLNPKVGIFYITFLPQFIPPGVNVAAFSLLLAGVHVLLSLVWFSVLIALTVPLGRFLASPRVVKTLDRLTGCVFLAFGAKLAVAQRS